MTRDVHGRVWAVNSHTFVVGDAWNRETYPIAESVLEWVQRQAVAVGALVRLSVNADGFAVDVKVLNRGSELAFSPGAETHKFATRELANRLRLRQQVISRIRAHFERLDFLEVETPCLVTSPGLDLHLSALRATADDQTHHGYLNTSPEYHMKRILVGGIPRCFQIARCFRTGEAGTRHQLEFSMLEWYRAWGQWPELLGDTEAVVRAAYGEQLAEGLFGVEAFESLTVRDAFSRWAPDIDDPISLATANEPEYFRLLSEKIEPQLGVNRPQFLTHFAAPHASLSQLYATDPTTCLRAELYYQGIELSNGFVELTDPREQTERLERDRRARAASGLGDYPIDGQFLNALEEGLPPTVGTALGLDRLVAMVLNCRDIGDVLAFPRQS